MKHFDVITVGSALKDIMFYSTEIKAQKSDNKSFQYLALPFGSKIPVDEIFINYGGGAMNVAVGLNNFGIKVAPLVCVGNDQVGKEIYTYLKNEKIDTTLLTVNKKKNTGFSIVVTSEKDKEHTIFTYKGASQELVLPRLSDYRMSWFYVSALAGKDWVYELEKIVRHTKRKVKIAWNPGERQLQDWAKMISFLPNIELLILNFSEAQGLLKNIKKKTPKEKLTNGRYLLEELRKLGPQKVVITKGANGAIAIDEEDDYFYSPAVGDSSKIVDTVGAGDAFGSGLLAGIIRFEDFEKALKVAIRNSASVLCRVGAQNGLLKIKL